MAIAAVILNLYILKRLPNTDNLTFVFLADGTESMDVKDCGVKSRIEVTRELIKPTSNLTK